jgi:hypothetical protein
MQEISSLFLLEGMVLDRIKIKLGYFLKKCGRILSFFWIGMIFCFQTWYVIITLEYKF